MPSRRRVIRDRILWASLLLSLVLHLVGVYLVRDVWWEEVVTESFRARLAHVLPQFKPRRLSVAQSESVDMPQVQMEYLETEREMRVVPEGELALETPAIQELEAPAAPSELRQFAAGAKEDEPILEREKMISPSELGLADSLGVPSMDLLRIVDMARANKDHALVIQDLGSRRDLMGYVNFTRLRVYGAGSDTGASLDALCRYLRDHTRLLARMRDDTYEYFLSEHLLKDPIHFLFQGGGLTAYRDEMMTYFSEEEKEMLDRYLRSGGFLYIEGSNRYLREMAGHLRAILGRDARLGPLGVEHPLYHAFYDFGGGFPGEDKGRMASVGENPSWYYPAQVREEQPSTQVTTFFNPTTTDPNQGQPPPLGIWGVELDGELVAVLSDLGLYTHWNEDDEADRPVLYSLMAATNIVAYALTRTQGLTTKMPPPAWMKTRPQAPVVGALGTEQEHRELALADPELLADLDASLALVQAPLGARVEQTLTVRLDGRYSLEMRKRGYHGLLLRNVPPGRHWIELHYGGERAQLEVEVRGGRVLTVNFGLNRIAFVSRLRIKSQEDQVDVGSWHNVFSDLQIEEIFLGEEGQRLQGPGGG